MGAGPSIEYKDKLAPKAVIAISAYIIGEVIWLAIWSGTILSLELTEQVGLDAGMFFILNSFYVELIFKI